MARNLYILAGTLLLFSIVSCGVSLLPSGSQPGLPGNGMLWKTMGIFLLLGALIAAISGMLTALFEQVSRRNEERSDRNKP